MSPSDISKYAQELNEVCRLRNLRRVKLFPNLFCFTIVMYYKNTFNPSEADYVGRINMWHIWKLRRVAITSTHNQQNYSPPKEEKESEEKDKSEEVKPQPALGLQQLQIA